MLTPVDLRIEEGFPFAKKVAARWIIVHGVSDNDADDVRSNAQYVMVILAHQWDAKHDVPWMRFLAGRIKYRLIDELRKQAGRATNVSFPERKLIRYTRTLDEAQLREGAHRESPTAYTEPGYDEVTEPDPDEEIERLIAGLTARKRQMVRARIAGKSMRAIGVLHGVTESRVSQILAEVRHDIAELRVVAVAVAKVG